MTKAVKYVKHIFFPERCESCNKLIPFNESDCIYCSSLQYRLPEEFCIHCNRRNCICDTDAHRLNLTVPFIYSGSIKHYIHRYKFGREKLFADFFAKNLFNCVVKDFYDVTFDFVTFIPSSDGNNHSELLSRKLARRLHCDCFPLLNRSRNTRKQHHLSYEERITNMKNAFTVIEGIDLKGKTVLICDDIKTTGSTLLAAEKALIEGGAEKVYCCTVATPVFAKAAPLDKEKENL